MSRSNTTLFDLPNEILLIILKKLDNMDVLYSLMDVDNQRLDMILREEAFTKSLNFILTTITDDVLSIGDSILDRFCMKILPKIDYNIKSLTLESGSMECILLAADYPNLTEIKLYKVNDYIILHHFTVESPFRRVFQKQITDFILVYDNDTKMLLMNPNTKYVYEYTLKFFQNLKFLSIIGCMQFLSIKNISSTTWLSLNLNKLCVDIYGFEDCLALLDGCLTQLSTFIDKRTTFIDGIQINDRILVHMPCLRKFTFSISTSVERHHLVHHPSIEDIQRTFINIGYDQVCRIQNNIIYAITFHVFTLPFAFKYLGDIGNSFPPVDFSCVTHLFVHDQIEFKHEFFLQIARCFPLLRKLNVNNSEPQLQMRDNLVRNNSEFYPTVEYPNLILLRLRFSCIDYYDQFLNERKTYLPHLTKLTVEYYELSFVTKNFTRKRTRCNCTKITELNLNTIIVHSKDFYDYFPLL